MICEEIGLNEALEASGIARVETDLGEYIVQLAGETPSHILAPAIHMTKERVADLFAVHHGRPRVATPDALLDEARQALRQRYFEADVGITGANFLVAATGSVVLVTNEGNAELTQGLPKTHIAVASLEKVVPTLEDACTLAARAVALGDRAGVLGLHHDRDRAQAARTTSTGPRASTSCWSTTAAARWSAASSRTSCAASAAAPA